MFNETSYNFHGLEGFSIQDLINLAAGAGCSQPEKAAAIAMAESSGNPGAHNPVAPDDSYGLWQINMIGRLGPERRAGFGISSNTALYDPATNARAMVAVSKGCTNFTPWTTYTSGAWQRFLTGSSGGGISPEPPDAPGGDSNGATTITSPVDLFSGASPLVILGALAAAYFLLR